MQTCCAGVSPYRPGYIADIEAECYDTKLSLAYAPRRVSGVARRRQTDSPYEDQAKRPRDVQPEPRARQEF